jgi:D-alanyl-D-alanine carboxypeptidase
MIAILTLVSPSTTSCQQPTPVDTADQSLSGPYLGQPPPGAQPSLFAPEALPVNGIQHCFPAFAPNGREVYWMLVEFDDDSPRGQIWFMREVDGIWSKPELAPFSGEFDDHAPVFSLDGQRLYFASTRPGGFGNSKNLWYVEKTNAGWSDPRNLGSPPNTEIGATQATFTAGGSVYFLGRREGTQWETGIYRCRFSDGKYLPPEPLEPPITTLHADVYPFIAPDESYLLFGSSRPGANSTETDLYISLRNADDTWSEPIQLDKSINNGKTVSFSCVTHDGKYLFFNRFDDDGTDKFYWVDAGILDKYGDRASVRSEKSGNGDERIYVEMNRILDSCRTALGIVGISAAAVWNAGTQWTGTSGIAADERATDDSMLFGIGSATKTYIAALILKYAELGMLNLDDTLGKWVDSDIFDADRITIRQLLNHTSGLFNYMAHPDYVSALYAYPDTLWTVDALLKSFAGESNGQPGQRWEYSATNYLLLGRIIEQVSGRLAAKELRSRLLEPLGLKDTYLYPQELYDTDRMAHLWMVIDSTDLLSDINNLVRHPPLQGLFSSVWTAGAVHATAIDAAKWLSSLLTGKVLKKSSLDAMTQPALQSGSVKYGLGIMTDDINGTLAVGHSGGIGYSSLVLYFPRDSLSLAVLCNSDADPRSIVSALHAAATDRRESNVKQDDDT